VNPAEAASVVTLLCCDHVDQTHLDGRAIRGVLRRTGLVRDL